MRFTLLPLGTAGRLPGGGRAWLEVLSLGDRRAGVLSEYLLEGFPLSKN